MATLLRLFVTSAQTSKTWEGRNRNVNCVVKAEFELPLSNSILQQPSPFHHSFTTIDFRSSSKYILLDERERDRETERQRDSESSIHLYLPPVSSSVRNPKESPRSCTSLAFIFISFLSLCDSARLSRMASHFWRVFNKSLCSPHWSVTSSARTARKSNCKTSDRAHNMSSHGTHSRNL